jgi:putative ABC transport system permease protein
MIDFLLFLPSIESGLIFLFPIFSMYISSRVLRVDDLTIEGSFALGGAVTALMLSMGHHPLSAMFVALLATAVAGLCTAFIHIFLSLSVLMSGIIVSTGLFSCNLRLSGANLSLANKTSIFSFLQGIILGDLLLLLFIAVIVGIGLIWFLKTEIGFFIRATGANPAMVIALGKRPSFFLTIGLVLANMLTGLSGSLFVQYVGFFSIWSSVGIMIITLAGLMLAELLGKGLGAHMFFGAVLYQLILLLTFELQCNADWNKLITAVCIIALLLVKQFLLKEKAA